MIQLKIENLNHYNLIKGDDNMRDILKMSYYERNLYLNNIDIDKQLENASNFRIKLDNKSPVSITQMIRKSHKILFGHNKQPKTIQDKINYLMVYLVVFQNINEYDNFIKESGLK